MTPKYIKRLKELTKLAEERLRKVGVTPHKEGVNFLSCFSHLVGFIEALPDDGVVSGGGTAGVCGGGGFSRPGTVTN